LHPLVLRLRYVKVSRSQTARNHSLREAPRSIRSSISWRWSRSRWALPGSAGKADRSVPRSESLRAKVFFRRKMPKATPKSAMYSGMIRYQIDRFGQEKYPGAQLLSSTTAWWRRKSRWRVCSWRKRSRC